MKTRGMDEKNGRARKIELRKEKRNSLDTRGMKGRMGKQGRRG